MTGEAVRDAMLAVAGTLNLRRGGPGVRPPLPPELLGTLLANQWRVSPDPADHVRRSIYVFARRNLRYPVFDVFDRPDANASCPQRNESTTAVQSLLMLNSTFAFSLARQFAGRVLAEQPSDMDAQIRWAVKLAYAREPSPQEFEVFRRFLDGQAQLLREERRPAEQLATPLPCPAGADVYTAAAFTDLCLALFNSNEFLHVD
jgi:hypothetical protein